jgi:NAD-dependent dihydropyrimidine dehydrogenase PreA subunit
MKVYRKIIEIDEDLCDGCGNCVPSCAEGALVMKDGKVKVIAEKLCDGLGACLGECPTGALKLIEREADEFDEEAVEAFLASQKAAGHDIQAGAGGCPSANVEILVPKKTDSQKEVPAKPEPNKDSALSHWPVQIRLVPAKAPFLKGADLLVLADCVPVAFPSLHRDFLQGRAVTMGCPKFDDKELYVQKFKEIFEEAGIKSVTTVIMEVPCCSGLPVIVKKGMKAAQKEVPMEQVVIGTQGQILQRIRS